MNKNDILTIKVGSVSYKMYLPNKEVDAIQKILYAENRPFEHVLLEDMVSRLDKDSYVLDVGLNIGNHAMYLAAHGINVIGFEANKKLSCIAQESVKLNKFEKRVKIHNCGISNKEHKAYFDVEYVENMGAMSLSMGEKEGRESIQCKTLDSFNIKEKISAIKIDVEGMEAEVVGGGGDLIAKNRPIIYLEANFAPDFVRIDRVMRDLKYVHWDLWSAFQSEFIPAHLYLPLESVSEKELIARSISQSALLNFYNTTRKENTFTNFALDTIYKEIQELKGAIYGNRL